MFDSNVLHIAEFMTVAKSLPHLWQKVRKLLIPKLFLSYSCIFNKNTLIPLSQIEAEDMHYDFSISDLQCSNVDLTPDRMHRSPQSLLFMLTNKCVTNCKYCYADKKTKCIELDTEKILALIEEAKQLKMSYIDIIGGEVFAKRLGHYPSQVSRFRLNS